MSMQDAVYERYSDGARATEPQLCCPVSYDPRYLAAIPSEILDKDYGCGDPSRYVHPGDVVLDLGSGGGKICYIAAQMVGAGGQVIGVDTNDDMLALARKYQPHMAQQLGGDRVRFLKGKIQDLALDLAAMDTWLARHPVHDARGMAALHAWQAEQKRRAPLVPDDSVDLVISNCVLNLVDEQEKQAVVREIFRVLKPHGRVAISDIVADEPVPATLKADPQLWSGCISGAFTETGFLDAFAQAGFVAIGLDTWATTPWQEVNGIEFRSVTLSAQKPAARPCQDKGHAVIYRGPFASVTDDEGHVFPRGERMAVCERTYQLVMQGDYWRISSASSPPPSRPAGRTARLPVPAGRLRKASGPRIYRRMLAPPAAIRVADAADRAEDNAMPMIAMPHGARYPWYVRLVFWMQRRKYGAELEPARLWGRSPKVFLALAGLYRAIDRASSPIEPALRSLVTVRVSQINWCAFCVDLNSATALERSVEAAKLAELPEFDRSLRYSAREKAALRYAEAVTITGRRVDETQMNDLKAHFSDDDIIELTALIAFQNLSSKFNAALDVPAQGFCRVPSGPPGAKGGRVLDPVAANDVEHDQRPRGET